MWIMSSSFGPAMTQLWPTAIPLLIAPNASHSVVDVPASDTKIDQRESRTESQIDAAAPIVLSDEQVKQIAETVKQRLDIDAILSSDPKTFTDSTTHDRDQLIDDIIERVVESASIQNIIENYNVHNLHADRNTLMRELQLQIDALRAELEAAKLESAGKYAQIALSVKRCCRLNLMTVQRHVNRMISTIFNSEQHRDEMAKWLATLFVAQHELEEKLENATRNMDARFHDLITASAHRLMDEIGLQLAGRATRVSEDAQMPPNERQIRAIVKEAFAVYDADKTGLVDYALESAGGQILSTRCTEHYSARTSVMSIFGVPLWYHTSGPRTVITPGVKPGECWAFQNFPGFVIVKLSHNVSIEAFSYEHVSRALTPSGRLDSAPKAIQVFGLRSEFDREPLLIGDYKYDALGDELQFFPVQQGTLTRSFQIVELKVNSNHGNPNYTCLYRFRVHGKLET